MSVYFHANFGLHRERMATLLQLALQNPENKDSQLAKAFGFGAPYSARYRSWLHKVGVINPGLPVKLSEMGQIIHELDPELQSISVKWSMHWELCSDPYRAESWYFFINEFLPEFPKFTKDDLLMGITNKLRVHREDHFGPGSEMNQVIVRKLLECYLEDRALGELGIIRQEEDWYFRQKPLKLGPFHSKEEFAKSITD